MFCQKCGNPMAEDAKFCQKCGAKLTVPETTQTTQVSPAPVSTAVHSNAASTPVTGFRAYVDNHVRTTTKFQSAEDLLNNSKPLRYVWWNIIPLLGFIVAAYITMFKMKKFKKNYPFPKDINVDELCQFLTVNLQYLAPAFGEWELASVSIEDKIISKIANTIVTKVMKKKQVDIKTVQCKFNGEKRSFATVEIITNQGGKEYNIFVRKEPAWYVHVLAFVMPGDSGNLLTEGGFGAYGRTYKAHPILMAAVEYYFKQKNGYDVPVEPITTATSEMAPYTNKIAQADAASHIREVSPEETNAIYTSGIAVTVAERREKAKRKKMLTAAIVSVASVIAVIILVLLLMSGGDQYVQFVKGGTLDNYPQATIGDAFDNFLSNAKWESLLADDGNRYVNVEGGALYNEKEVKVAVQFLIDPDEEGLGINAFEINGVPQNTLILFGLLEKAYEDAETAPPVSRNKNTSANTTSINIVNNTGYTIRFVYVTPADQEATSSPQEVKLLNGQSITMPSLQTKKRYNITLIDSDGDYYFKENVSISPNQRIVFTLNDLANDTDYDDDDGF